MKCVHLFYICVQLTYKICASDVQNQCIRTTKVVHPTYKSCASDLQKLCIRPSIVVHPTYKICAFYLQKLCIRPSKVVHPTYQNCASGPSVVNIFSELKVRNMHQIFKYFFQNYYEHNLVQEFRLEMGFMLFCGQFYESQKIGSR